MVPGRGNQRAGHRHRHAWRFSCEGEAECSPHPWDSPLWGQLKLSQNAPGVLVEPIVVLIQPPAEYKKAPLLLARLYVVWCPVGGINGPASGTDTRGGGL